MSLRKDESEAIYQVAKKTNSKHLTQEELVKDYKYWIVVKNRFPWDKLVEETHDMFVLKRDTCLDEIEQAELNELWFEIIPWANKNYDALVINMDIMRSVQCTPHVHAIIYQSQFKPHLQTTQ